MLVKTNIIPVKTKCSYQLIKPLHIATTSHYARDAKRWVRTSNVFILNHLLTWNLAEFVVNLPDVPTRLLLLFINEYICVKYTCILRFCLLNPTSHAVARLPLAHPVRSSFKIWLHDTLTQNAFVMFKIIWMQLLSSETIWMPISQDVKGIMLMALFSGRKRLYTFRVPYILFKGLKYAGVVPLWLIFRAISMFFSQLAHRASDRQE